MVAIILPAPPPPWGLGQYVPSHFFQSMVMLPIKLKGITKCSNMVEIVQIILFLLNYSLKTSG